VVIKYYNRPKNRDCASKIFRKEKIIKKFRGFNGEGIMKELKRYLDSRIGEFSFYFEDLKSGYTYGFHHKKQMDAAESIMLPIAIALMKEVEDKSLSLEDKVTIGDDEKYDSYCGIMKYLNSREFTLNELLIAITVQSDLTAANKIIEILGFEKINMHLKSMGLKNTVINSKLGENGNNLSTAYELSKCFSLLYREEYLNKKNSKLLIELLTNSQFRNKIPFYLPIDSWSSIANKAGHKENVEIDSSLLNIKKGDFVFTVMTKNLPSNVYGITIISRLAKMMWDIIDSNWR